MPTRRCKRCQPLLAVGEPRDWSKLFDGGIYQLIEGEDFEVGVKLYATFVEDKAKRMGVKINIDVVDKDGEDDSYIVVQAIRE